MGRQLEGVSSVTCFEEIVDVCAKPVVVKGAGGDGLGKEVECRVSQVIYVFRQLLWHTAVILKRVRVL